MGKGSDQWEGGERETRREGAERGEKARLGYLSSGPLYIVPSYATALKTHCTDINRNNTTVRAY